MNIPMKRRLASLALAGSVGLAGCQDFLDVNTNPNAPETVAANLYLSPMLHWMVTGQYWDGRCTGQYTQQFTQSALSTYDMHGPNYNTDLCGQVWRDVYWTFGQNLIDMMEIAEAEERWDILGVGYVMKAWGWQQLTDMHGEIIVSEAFDQTKFDFGYDSQEFVYDEIAKLLDSAIVYLNRTDGAVDSRYMARGDRLYGGDRVKWLQFAHGLYAIHLNHLSEKAEYDPAAVISHVDQALQSNADDALWGFTNEQAFDDRNVMSPTRGNYASYKQTQQIVQLMDGTIFGVADPRMTRMLVPAPDSAYRGVPVATSFTAIPAAQLPMTPWRYVSARPEGWGGFYLFSDEVRLPAMTYAQLQFVKAEAAYHAGNMPVALEAFRNGVSSSIDFVNDRNTEAGSPAPAITQAEKDAFLAAIVPATPGALTLTMIMNQKFIAQWAWGYNETWTDMRRYHYTDLDPATGEAVYPAWEVLPPTSLHSWNNGEYAYRLRPRYNSEYVWNEKGLQEIGGLELDYHTKPIWIVTP
jgi:hypothetical protein